jgi:hypothetical protein
MRHELMDFMFSDPTMLDDLEFLFKSDMARSLLFFYQARDITRDSQNRARVVHKYSSSKIHKCLFIPFNFYGQLPY